MFTPKGFWGGVMLSYVLGFLGAYLIVVGCYFLWKKFMSRYKIKGEL